MGRGPATVGRRASRPAPATAPLPGGHRRRERPAGGERPSRRPVSSSGPPARRRDLRFLPFAALVDEWSNDPRTLLPQSSLPRSWRSRQPATERLDSRHDDLLAPAGEAPPEADSTRGFSSVSCRIEIPVDLPALEKLPCRLGSVYRAEGLARVGGREGAQELQWVPPSLEARPCPAEPPERGELVVIGRRVPWDRFCRDLEACLVRPPRSRARAEKDRRRG